jgi:spoIIIJ-associated protein
MEYQIPFEDAQGLEDTLSRLSFVEPEVIEEKEVEAGKVAFVRENTAERGRKVVEEILHLIGLEARVESEELEETVRIKIEGRDLALLIGAKGKTLDALQLLVSIILNRYATLSKFVSVDAGGYRERRSEYLQSLAKRTARRVLEERKPLSLGPLPASERRIVHLALQDFDGVTTESEGVEPERKVIIYPHRVESNETEADLPKNTET